jgi:hypothetical protein
MNALRYTALAALLIVSAAHAAQPVVVNGSLSGSIENNAVPSGWTIFEGTPDLMDAHDNIGMANVLRFGATPDASPDGGTWVGLGADTNYTERFGQMLNNLTIGQAYTVSWYAGNFGYASAANSYLGQNAISVLIDGVSIGAGAKLAVASNWYQQSLNFVANASSQQLSFKLATPEKAYVSIDGIAIQTAPVPVPEPGTYALMALGLGAIGMVVRRRQKA